MGQPAGQLVSHSLERGPPATNGAQWQYSDLCEDEKCALSSISKRTTRNVSLQRSICVNGTEAKGD